MIGGLVAGAVAGYGVALPIGAIGTYLAGLGARERFACAGAAALGVATTDGGFALTASIGGAGAQGVLRPISAPLRLMAVAALVGFAARMVVTGLRRYRAGTPERAADGAGLRPLRAYLALVAVTALNPLTIGYFATLVLGRQAGGGDPSILYGCVFALGAFVASASWQLFLVGSGAALGRMVTSARGQVVVALTSAAIMIALALTLFMS